MTEKPRIKKRRRISYLPSIISIAMVLFMLGLLGIIIIGGKNLSNYLKENFQITVFFRKEVPEAELQRIHRQIEMAEYTKSARLVSEEEAAREFTQEIGQDFVSFLGFNPLLPSIELFLKSSFANSKSISRIDAEIRRNPEVQEIVYQKSIIEEINKNVNTIGTALIGLSVIFLIIAITLINNTIRLNLYAMRFIIKSMQLVGATHRFIIKPFVFKSFLHGLYGGIMACLLLAALLYWIPYWVEGIQLLYNDIQFAILFLGIIIAGIIISMVSSMISTNRYLSLKIEELY